MGVGIGRSAGVPGGAAGGAGGRVTGGVPPCGGQSDAAPGGVLCPDAAEGDRVAGGAVRLCAGQCGVRGAVSGGVMGVGETYFRPLKKRTQRCIFSGNCSAMRLRLRRRGRFAPGDRLCGRRGSVHAGGRPAKSLPEAISIAERQAAIQEATRCSPKFKNGATVLLCEYQQPSPPQCIWKTTRLLR